MMRPEEIDTVEPSPSTGKLHDRRRPGRKNYKNKFLIAMLRRSQPVAPIPNANSEDAQTAATVGDDDDNDQLRAARGIILALFLGLASWVIIGLAVWGLSYL